MHHSFMGLLLFLVVTFTVQAGEFDKVINGEIVPKGQLPDVVAIRTNGAGCTATLVGPTILITAAHCGNSGDTTTFSLNGKQLSGKFLNVADWKRSGLDLAVVLLSKKVSGVKFRNIGKELFVGDPITLSGYGCTGWSRGDYGVLRKGEASVTSFADNMDFKELDMILDGKSTLCFGDSGGPAFKVENGEMVIIGINSRGNGITAYDIRLDHEASRKWLLEVSEKHGKRICGLKTDC